MLLLDHIDKVLVTLIELTFLLLLLEHILLIRVQHNIFNHFKVASELLFEACMFLRKVLLQSL